MHGDINVNSDTFYIKNVAKTYLVRAIMVDTPNHIKYEVKVIFKYRQEVIFEKRGNEGSGKSINMQGRLSSEYVPLSRNSVAMATIITQNSLAHFPRSPVYPRPVFAIV
jgi:hypothetical protein